MKAAPVRETKAERVSAGQKGKGRTGFKKGEPGRD